MPSFDYRRETHSMTLSQFREYYQEEGYPQAFIVEQNQCMTGECRLQEGQIAIACHERTVLVLQATVLLKDGRTRPASIPINLKVLFALLPAENSMKFSGHPKLSAKDILQAKDGLPKAVQVLGPCKNSKKQPVPPNEVLFNVTKSGKHDFTGTSAAGVRHTFREGDSTAQFSSRLGDVKVYPVKFFDHITFPQKARVYLSEGQDCQVEGLEHLCVVEFTGRHEQLFLAIMPNIDDPENRDCQAVPSDLDIMVSAVTLKGYPMENLTLKDRKMIKQRSTDNVIQPPGNLYVAKPVDPTVRDEPDPAHLCDPAPPDSRRQSQISLARSQSTFSVNMEIHYYNWPPEGPEGAVSPQTPGRQSIGLRLLPPGLSKSEQCLPTCVEDPSEYAYVQLDLPTPVQPRGPPTPTPQHAKPKHRMSLPLQPLQVSPRPQQPDTIDEDDSHSSTPPPPPQHAKPKHRMSVPLQPSQVSPRPQQPDTIDEDDSHSTLPPPPPQHAKPKHRRSLPPKSSPVLPRPQQPDTIDEDAYEEMEVPEGDKSIRQQKGQVPVAWKLSQPQASRPSPPVSPAFPHHSTKHQLDQADVAHAQLEEKAMEAKKPIKLNSCPNEPELRFHVAARLGQDWRSVCSYLGLQNYELEQAVVAHAQLEEKAMEAKKPIKLNSCPKEPELRFHVAARLGQDWRSVCSYLGLQNYELEQADVAHAKLEDKAMEALFMWLSGQGKSNAPRSWKTLVEALCWAGHKDMASGLERHIKNKTLEVKLPMSAPQAPKKLTTHSTVTTLPSPASTDTAATYGSFLEHTRAGLVFPKQPDIDIKASEAALDDLCWIPLGVQIQSAGPEGRRLPLAGPMEGGGRAIHLEVPPGAVGPSVTLEVHSAVIPNGPFTLPEGYQFGSHVVYIYFDGHHVTSPLHLHLPHWYGGQDQVQDGLSFAMAPHTLKEGESVYCFKLLEGGRFLNHCGELEIDGHCSLFAEVFKKGATSRYQAITLQKEEGNETTCDVAVMYATPLWCEILMKYRTGKSGWTVSNPTCPFTLKEGRIRGVLKEEHGNGWHAVISGSHELEPRHLEYDYHGITSPKLLEKAVNNRGYPPAITCVVTYREELRKIGNPVWVVLDLLGAENKLSFMCKAYEQTGRNAAAAAPQSPCTSSTDVMAEPAPRHSLDQKPTMRSLDEKLVVHVAGRWDSTGLHLNIEDHVLQAIRTPNGSSDEHCREMLRRWLNGEQGCGNLPRTWSSVLDAVEIGCGSEVCQRIKELL